jgi:hypothetical protein
MGSTLVFMGSILVSMGSVSKPSLIPNMFPQLIILVSLVKLE